jgi:hypothetical protein
LCAFSPKILRLHPMYVAKFLKKNRYKILTNLLSFHLQRPIVTMYALLNKISWACENGIQFNQNTSTKVDWERAICEKKVIKSLAKKLRINGNDIKKYCK